MSSVLLALIQVYKVLGSARRFAGYALSTRSDGYCLFYGKVKAGILMSAPPAQGLYRFLSFAYQVIVPSDGRLGRHKRPTLQQRNAVD